MSITTLNTIVAKAVVSDKFRAGILNGKKAELIREFDLDPGEVTEIMAIRAGSLAEFAAAIEKMTQTHELSHAAIARNWNDTAYRFVSR